MLRCYRRCFRTSHWSPATNADEKTRAVRVTKFQFIKLLTSLALPLAVAIFTLITTLQNRHIARQIREQDRVQSEDDQRQSVFVNYIDDISRFRDENIGNLTHNIDKLLYIRTKTLTALRKLDEKRKRYILLFLYESSLLIEDEHSLLDGADFSRVHIYPKDCMFRDVIFSGVAFQEVSLSHCVFENVTFHRVDLRRAALAHSAFANTNFISCRMDDADLRHTVISECVFNQSVLTAVDFHQAKIDFVVFHNVNLSGASFFDDRNRLPESTLLQNSILPNGSFSFVEPIDVNLSFCAPDNQWYARPEEGIQWLNCTLITRLSNVTISQWIRWPLVERSMLIDGNQAELVFEAHQPPPARPISLFIYNVGIQHGVFEMVEFDCLPISETVCQRRFHLMPHTRQILLHLRFNAANITLESASYSIRRVESGVLRGSAAPKQPGWA